LVVQERSVQPNFYLSREQNPQTDGLSILYLQIITKKVGRPASSATKKSIGRLSKGRKGRKALGGNATVTITNRDQTQNSSDEDDNPGDTDISSEDEEGESDIEQLSRWK
jgi:hypothetical protein